VTERMNFSGIVSNSGEGEEQTAKENVPGECGRLKLFVIYGSQSRMIINALNTRTYNLYTPDNDYQRCNCSEQEMELTLHFPLLCNAELICIVNVGVGS